MIKVVIVDDQILIRESIGYILDTDSEIEVLGFAGSGKEAIKVCESLKPDIILMDIEMLDVNGIKSAEKIKEQYKDIKIVMLTTFVKHLQIL